MFTVKEPMKLSFLITPHRNGCAQHSDRQPRFLLQICLEGFSAVGYGQAILADSFA
jgi:hypothetical protein